MTQPPNSNATDVEREKLVGLLAPYFTHRGWQIAVACDILAAGFRLAPIETNAKSMQLQGVDSQVMVHARDMGKTNQPEWLWYDRETDTRSFGRWQKPISNASEENQPAPYIRADIVLLRALPSLTPADLIQARAQGMEEAVQEVRDAVAFVDRVRAATEAEKNAVGTDHWDRLESAARQLAAIPRHVEQEDER